MLDVTYQSTLDVFLLGVLQVFFLAAPGLEGRSLEGTAIREGQGPWLVQRALIDGIQMDGSLFLTLTSRQESDACDHRKNVSRSGRTKHGFKVYGK